MILTCDVKGLEWVSGTYLSKDKVAYEEIWNGDDQHSDNQKRFGLPSRLIAKVFVFRLIYGGSAYSYANDPDFTEVSTSQTYWQEVIDAFYDKYQGWREWHRQLVIDVGKSGMYYSTTGRSYKFDLNERGELPRTKILNYPVQGFGADLVSLARVSLFRRMKNKNYKSLLINTVHDSIDIDCPSSEIDLIKEEVIKVFKDLPKNFQKIYGKLFDLPLTVEFK